MSIQYYAVVRPGMTPDKPSVVFREIETETEQSYQRWDPRRKRWVVDNALMRYFIGDDDDAEPIDEKTAKQAMEFIAEEMKAFAMLQDKEDRRRG